VIRTYFAQRHLDVEQGELQSRATRTLKRRRLMKFFAQLCLTLTIATAAAGAESTSSFHYMAKPSFQVLATKLKEAEAITELFKETMASPVPEKKFQKLWKENQKALTDLEHKFSDSAPFVRGEIEDEKNMNGLMTYLELALLDVRFQADKKAAAKWSEIETHFRNWFTFAADFPYEEASMVGLKVTGVVRSLLLDELEKVQEQNKTEIAKADALRSWFLQVRAPWPVDRMVLSESRRLLKPPMMKIAEKVATSLQKNPYESSEDVVKSLHAQDMDEAHYLNAMWKKSDIDMMKTEITRIGRLKLRLAMAEFEFKKGEKPKTADQLVQAGFLDQVPVNYSTGKVFDLSTFQ